MKYQINIVSSAEVLNTLNNIDCNHKSIYVLDTKHSDISIEKNRKLWALVHLYRSFLDEDNKVFVTSDPDLDLDNVNSSRSPSHVQICKELLAGPSDLGNLADIDKELFMVYIPEVSYANHRSRDKSFLDKLFPPCRVRRG